MLLLPAARRLSLLVNFLSYPPRFIGGATNYSRDMSDKAITVLIVGANRGIGYNLASAFANKSYNVFGSVRPETRYSDDPTLEQLEKTGATILEIDLSDEETVEKTAREFGTRPLDILINVAGVGPEPDNWYEHTEDTLMKKFRINTVGVFLTTKHFHPNLKKASGKIINISSNAGSITTCKGEDMGYRMSKAALNMMTVAMAKEFEMNGEDIVALALNPGYVATRLTNGRSKNDMNECVAGMVKVIESAGPEQSGKFLDWRGEELPW